MLVSWVVLHRKPGGWSFITLYDRRPSVLCREGLIGAQSPLHSLPWRGRLPGWGILSSSCPGAPGGPVLTDSGDDLSKPCRVIFLRASPAGDSLAYHANLTQQRPPRHSKFHVSPCNPVYTLGLEQSGQHSISSTCWMEQGQRPQSTGHIWPVFHFYTSQEWFLRFFNGWEKYQKKNNISWHVERI